MTVHICHGHPDWEPHVGPVCPVCGAKDPVYVTRSKKTLEIVGCSECLTTIDAMDCPECFRETEI